MKTSCRIFAVLISLTPCAPHVLGAEPRQTSTDDSQRAESEPPAAPSGYIPALSDILATKTRVRYRRDHLGEVLLDLSRTGLQTAFPDPLDGTFTFDLTAERVAVGEVLEKLAAAGDLVLEYREEVAVFWKRADDARLQSLAAIVKDPQAVGRCRAILDLAELGDPRIYPVLFWAMAEGTDPMAVAAFRVLYSNHFTTLRFAEDLDVLGRGLKRLVLSRTAHDEQQSLWYLARKMQSPSCGEALLPLLYDEDGSLRYDIAWTMASNRTPVIIEPLLAQIDKVPAYNRPEQFLVTHESIIAMLGEIGTPRAVATLRQMAQDEHDTRRLAYLGGALATAHDPRGFEILRKLLAGPNVTGPDTTGPNTTATRGGASAGGGAAGGAGLGYDLHRTVIWALEYSHDQRAVEPLIAALDTVSATNRLYAARSLGELRQRRAVEPLIELMAGDEAATGSAIRALEQIGDYRAADALARLLDNESDAVRGHAAAVLTAWGDPRGRDTLVELLGSENQKIRNQAVDALTWVDDPAGIEALVAQLKHEEADPRRRAADRLARLRVVSTIPSLVELLKDPDVSASFAAGAAIGGMRHPQAVATAIALTRDNDPKMRLWGVRMLGGMHAADTGPLIDALDDRDDEVRAYAAVSLCRIGDPRSLDAVLALLKDPQYIVRYYTAQALGTVREQKTIDALFAALNDQSIRRAAGQSLLATHDPGAIERLALLANTDNANDPASAAAAGAFHAPGNAQLSRYKADPCVMEHLILMMQHEDANVRWHAAAALGPMDDVCAIDPLLAALEDPDERVRETARGMLRRYREEPKVREVLEP